MENQIGQWVAIGIVVAFIAIEKAMKLLGNKKNSNPGHGERIAKLETEVKNIKDDIGEIKGKLE